MTGNTYVCGDRLTLADTLLSAFLDFAAGVGLPINPERKSIAAWHARMMARPSAAA
jgi:glutathione S-transferase